MALAGELAKYIGNEIVKTGGKELAKAGAKSALSSLVPSVATKVGADLATKAGEGVLRNVLVNQSKSVAEKIPVAVGDASKISLYRGMHADSPANLQKYIEDMKNPNIVPRTYTGNAFAGDGYHFYDNIEGAREYARDGINLGEPYGAVVKIDVPKNRFIGINSQNGTDATWATGESGVSTSAHERMHAWQDINKFDWDEEVGDAIDELRGELKKFYHDEDTIKKYWGNSKTDYYKEDIEQEARMLQSYLDNEGYTNTYRKTSEKGTEWGDEIKPAFDKFFKKLRALSKKGVALPAIAGLFGLGAISSKKDGKKLDNIE